MVFVYVIENDVKVDVKVSSQITNTSYICIGLPTVASYDFLKWYLFLTIVKTQSTMMSKVSQSLAL